MKAFFTVTLISCIIALSSCNTECDPGKLPENDNIAFAIKNNNGTFYLQYPGLLTLPDSVKITNLATNAIVVNTLIQDTVVLISNFDKSNNAITKLKIAKGTFLKADTIEVKTVITNVSDNCGNTYPVARFEYFKINNVTKCAPCAGDLYQTYIRN